MELAFLSYHYYLNYYEDSVSTSFMYSFCEGFILGFEEDGVLQFEMLGEGSEILKGMKRSSLDTAGVKTIKTQHCFRYEDNKML